MTLKFGTDGVRGIANLDLTPELLVALGRAAARVLGGTEVVVGRDTRRSGPLLQAALSCGFAAEGVTVGDLGVAPTPAVAHLSATQQVPGVVISASHNRFADNGVKFFSPGGRKLDDDTESALEDELSQVMVEGPQARQGSPTGSEVGGLVAASVGVEEYHRHLVEDVIGGRDLTGLRVVVDCANGAATTVAPDVFRQLGAEVAVIGDRPDGTNINEGCGSTSPAELQRVVVDHSADVGLAFDGDADRVVAVDAAGDLIDGDHIIAVCAADLHERRLLRDDTVVVTVMSNLGFRLAMEELDIKVVETGVGDRAVLEALARGRYTLGGEQSGHVIFHDLATTGDGLLTGISLLDVVARTGRTLADLASVMTRLPQVLVNVRVGHRLPEIAVEVAADIAQAEADLGGHGRVLVRASGTEPVVRVMVEAPNSQQAASVADRLVSAVGRVAGHPPPAGFDPLSVPTGRPS